MYGVATAALNPLFSYSRRSFHSNIASTIPEGHSPLGFLAHVIASHAEVPKFYCVFLPAPFEGSATVYVVLYSVQTLVLEMV